MHEYANDIDGGHYCQMQSYGSPPAEIMGPMPPGMDFGPDGTPKLPEGCVIS